MERAYPLLLFVFLIAIIVLSSSNFAIAGEIHEAVRRGDLAEVSSLVDAAPDLLFSRDSTGQTLLHLAASYCHLDIAQLLAANKSDVNARDSQGNTPLHAAATKNCTEVLQFLLIREANVNAKNDMGATALDLAARNGNLAQVEILVANKADIGAMEEAGTTGRPVAPQSNETDLLGEVIGRQQSQDVAVISILDAVRDGNLPRVKEMLQRSPGLIRCTDVRDRKSVV